MASAMIRLVSKRPTLKWIEQSRGSLALTGFAGKSDINGFGNAMKFSTTPAALRDRSSLFEQAREFSKRTELVTERIYVQESDSDSDHEHRPRGTSLFWRRKMRTLHNVLDVNKDGVISFDDFMLLADKFGALGNLSDEYLQKFRGAMRKSWEHQWGEVSPYNLVTVEQYLKDMEHVLNDKDLVKKAQCFLPYFFKAVDKDQSGFISLKEFTIFYQCLGLTPENASIAFFVIDGNGDGKLTEKEFFKLGKDFFVSEDEHRISRMFWGPLIDH